MTDCGFTVSVPRRKRVRGMKFSEMTNLFVGSSDNNSNWYYKDRMNVNTIYTYGHSGQLEGDTETVTCSSVTGATGDGRDSSTERDAVTSLAGCIVLQNVASSETLPSLCANNGNQTSNVVSTVVSTVVASHDTFNGNTVNNKPFGRIVIKVAHDDENVDDSGAEYSENDKGEHSSESFTGSRPGSCSPISSCKTGPVTISINSDSASTGYGSQNTSPRSTSPPCTSPRSTSSQNTSLPWNTLQGSSPGSHPDQTWSERIDSPDALNRGWSLPISSDDRCQDVITGNWILRKQNVCADVSRGEKLRVISNDVSGSEDDMKEEICRREILSREQDKQDDYTYNKMDYEDSFQAFSEPRACNNIAKQNNINMNHDYKKGGKAQKSSKHQSRNKEKRREIANTESGHYSDSDSGDHGSSAKDGTEFNEVTHASKRNSELQMEALDKLPEMPSENKVYSDHSLRNQRNMSFRCQSMSDLRQSSTPTPRLHNKPTLNRSLNDLSHTKHFNPLSPRPNKAISTRDGRYNYRDGRYDSSQYQYAYEPLYEAVSPYYAPPMSRYSWTAYDPTPYHFMSYDDVRYCPSYPYGYSPQYGSMADIRYHQDNIYESNYMSLQRLSDYQDNTYGRKPRSSSYRGPDDNFSKKARSPFLRKKRTSWNLPKPRVRYEEECYGVIGSSRLSVENDKKTQLQR